MEKEEDKNTRRAICVSGNSGCEWEQHLELDSIAVNFL